MTSQPNTAATGSKTITVFEPLTTRVVFSENAMKAFKEEAPKHRYGLEGVVNSFINSALTTWTDKSDQAEIRGVVEYGNRTLAVTAVFREQVSYTRLKDCQQRSNGSFSTKRIIDKLNNSPYAKDHNLEGAVLYIEQLDR
jgi:hypothetical protein